MTTTADPYAAIRNLKFTPSYIVQANLGGGNRINETYTTAAEAEARRAALGVPNARVTTSFLPDDAALRSGGFQTKYGSNAVDQGDGTFLVNLQQPNGHKFDTMDAVFKIDPATGQAVLQNDPMENKTRQTSSARQNMTAIATGAAFIGGGAALANAAGLGGAATTGATSGLDAYYLSGAVEGSTVGGAAAGGGAAGAVGSGSLASAIAAPMEAGLLSTGGTATAGTTAATPTLASAAPSAAGPATMANTFGSTGMSSFGDWIQLGGLVNSIVNKPKAPDTSGLNAAATANANIAERQQGLAEKQYADSQALFNEFKPFLVQQMQTSASEQQKSIQRSDDQWNSYLTTYRPIEQQMAEKSLNWASEPRMRAEAERAGAEVQGQFDRARTSTSQRLTMAGASPEKVAALEAAGRLEEARAVGGVQGETRRAVEKEGMAYLDNVARFGRGMPSTGLAAAGLAGSQGAQASGGYGTLANAQTLPAASSNSLFNSAVSSNNSAGKLAGAASSTAYGGALDQWGIDMGTYTGLARLFTSSKKTKHVGGKVTGAADKVEKSGADYWAYKKGEGDGNTKPRMGPMAENLAAVAPEVSDGNRVDAISLAGLHHAAIGELSRDVKALKRRLTLADAT